MNQYSIQLGRYSTTASGISVPSRSTNGSKKQRRSLSIEKQRFESTVLFISRQLSRTNSTAPSRYMSKRFRNLSPHLSSTRVGTSVSNHESTKGINGRAPKIPGSRYTMPHRLTVAGDATVRSSTSNIIVITDVRAIISPEARHSFLLSSRTVFMFSIQMASTGPSKTNHFLMSSSAATPRLTSVDRIPSVHSRVKGSNDP
mmetsp:Transcript_32450/g.97826  ORF Transcript_32450/g.97826 Transcript_32450/m.97826 type:complete len:201 (-) Transcript_32450:5538-6140(-)